jgi:hypothetical protein
MRATLPQATIDYCLNCLPPSSPIRQNIDFLILTSPFLFIFLIHQILLRRLFSLFSRSLLPLSSLLTCCHSSFLSFLFQLISYLLPLLSILTCYHLLSLSSLFQLAIISSLSPLSYNLLSSPLSLLSLTTCYHLLFLSSLF